MSAILPIRYFFPFPNQSYCVFMKRLYSRPKKQMLSTREQFHEKIILAICLLICLGFFVKIVFF